MVIIKNSIIGVLKCIAYIKRILMEKNKLALMQILFICSFFSLKLHPCYLPSPWRNSFHIFIAWFLVMNWVSFHFHLCIYFVWSSLLKDACATYSSLGWFSTSTEKYSFNFGWYVFMRSHTPSHWHVPMFSMSFPLTTFKGFLHVSCLWGWACVRVYPAPGIHCCRYLSTACRGGTETGQQPVNPSTNNHSRCFWGGQLFFFL